MNILLVNDDGIKSEGMLALVRELAPRHRLTVVAPESERSGFSHSLSVWQRLTVTEYTFPDFQEVPAYMVAGTPADCARIALTTLCGEKPDLVISGINAGSNLGMEILYSGTFSAACEAATFGVRALAVSQFWGTMDYAPAAEFTRRMVDKLDALDYPEKCVVNVNFPEGKAKGIRVTGLCAGNMPTSYRMLEQTDEKTRVYQLDRHHLTPRELQGDEKAVREGFVSITPISYERSVGAGEILQNWVENGCFLQN